VGVDGYSKSARPKKGSSDRGLPRAEVTITLTEAQVGQVARAAANGGGGMLGLLAQQTGPEAAALAAQSSAELGPISRSTLRALLVLRAFPPDGSYLTLAEVAEAVGMSPSTAHRYVTTWVVVGVLEQEAVTRRYRVCVDR
jgi:IclR helix-turn-helix domain